MRLTLCRCGVVTGGARAPHAHCPVHRDTDVRRRLRTLLKTWRAISDAAHVQQTKPQHEKYKAYRHCADQLADAMDEGDRERTHQPGNVRGASVEGR